MRRCRADALKEAALVLPYNKAPYSGPNYSFPIMVHDVYQILGISAFPKQCHLPLSHTTLPASTASFILHKAHLLVVSMMSHAALAMMKSSRPRFELPKKVSIVRVPSYLS